MRCIATERAKAVIQRVYAQKDGKYLVFTLVYTTFAPLFKREYNEDCPMV